jgi:hypothetical protein
MDVAKKGIPPRTHKMYFKSADQQKRQEQNSSKRKRGPNSATVKLHDVREALECAQEDLDIAELVASRSASKVFQKVIAALLPKDPSQQLEVFICLLYFVVLNDEAQTPKHST